MTRARGQPSKRMVDREFPYQVTVPAENVDGDNIPIVELFHAQIGAPRHSHSVRKDDRWFAVYCFVNPQHARSFEALFGGSAMHSR